MTPEEAQKLRPYDKVWLRYTPSLGHGESIDDIVTVKYVGMEVCTRFDGVPYVWVWVQYESEGFTRTSGFASIFLSKVGF
jgi:hypothetical protein